MIEASNNSTQNQSSPSFENMVVRPLESSDIDELTKIIRSSFSNFEKGKVTHASLKRAEKLSEVYSTEGSSYIVASVNGRVVGGAGIGPLAGLPLSEGMGEIRDFVTLKEYQGRGIGGLVLQSTLIRAKSYDYKRIYLETTPKMKQAQKLFRRHGFQPVVEKISQTNNEDNKKNKQDEFPCYFVLDQMTSVNKN